MTAALIGSFGRAVPPARRQEELWDGYFASYYDHNKVAERLFQKVEVDTRCGVVDPRVEDVSQWGTAARMERFVAEAIPLGKEAVSAALSGAGVKPDDLGMFVVASCTGYATPGLNILLARDLGMPANLRSLLVGHMGCHAALPGLGAAADYVSVHQRPALLLCVELTSLHLQPAEPVPHPLTPDAVQQMVVHALFGDAAAAVVLTPDAQAGSLEVVEVASVTDTATSDMMTWDVTDFGFRMGLSPLVPDVLARHVGPAVHDLLFRHGLALPDVAGWVVHPGGPRILEAVGEALDLPAEAIQPSRDVLREYGNCSSATVLLILDQVRTQVAAGGYVVALAFGPGLTLYATLLRVH
jgi:predicted naringenin-chalcone synthase